MKWLIEDGMFKENETELIKVLIDKDIEVKLMPYVPFDEIVILEEEKIINQALKLFPEDKDVVFYGSLGFATKLKELGWKGVYAEYEKYDCLTYLPVFKNEALNYDYLMMPYGDIKNKSEMIYNFYHNDKVFMRPNSVLKEFAGQVVAQNFLDEALEVMGFYDVEDNLLTVISSCKEVEKEWRFVVSKGEISRR